MSIIRKYNTRNLREAENKEETNVGNLNYLLTTERQLLPFHAAPCGVTAQRPRCLCFIILYIVIICIYSILHK